MKITCHDNPDGNIDLYIDINRQLCISYGPTGITIRHHSEEREIQDVTTACDNRFHVDTKGCKQFGFTSGEKIFVIKTEIFVIIRGTSIKPPGVVKRWVTKFYGYRLREFQSFSILIFL